MIPVSTKRQPSLFLSHGGGPGFFIDGNGSLFQDIDKNSPGKTFFSDSLIQHLPQEPRAVVVVSAHWESPIIKVGYQQSKTSLIYDYYGFPEETYAPYLTYDAPTDLQLADKILGLLTSAGIPAGKEDRGFDHGVFCPLKLMFPKANIPIVQVSLNGNLDAKSHIALGRALAPLRDENVLIIGSGQMTHNLRELRSAIGKSTWADGFTSWVHDLLSNLNSQTIEEVEDNLVHIMDRAPRAHSAHPRTEHLMPLHVAFGAATASVNRQQCEGEEVKARRIFSYLAMGNLSLDTYLFD
jgi:aromatic ring-opening dioxygenase catalytic subunit (LigB family)